MVVLLKKPIKRYIEKRYIEKIGLILFIVGVGFLPYHAYMNNEFQYYVGIAAIAIGGLCYYYGGINKNANKTKTI